MVRLADLPEPEGSHLAHLPCPEFDTNPWVAGPPVAQRRVALISTAGITRRGDRPFGLGANDYRIIPGDSTDVVMSHVSVNFDRTGFQQDLNVIFPLDRLRELAANGEIGSVAEYHYSFMGAADPANLEDAARSLAGVLKGDKVDAAFLLPV